MNYNKDLHTHKLMPVNKISDYSREKKRHRETHKKLITAHGEIDKLRAELRRVKTGLRDMVNTIWS